MDVGEDTEDMYAPEVISFTSDCSALVQADRVFCSKMYLHSWFMSWKQYVMFLEW